MGAVIAMFLLGEAMYNERVGWLSAGFLAVSPLFWFYGEIALLAIAGGVRQQPLVFLAPLLRFAFRKIGWRLFIGAGVVGVIACLLWFVPLITLSGGLSQYLAVMKDFSDRFQQTTSIFMGAGLFGLRRNATKLILYSAYGWGIVFVPFAYAAVRKIGEGRKIRLEARAVFIGLWVLPAVLFYLLVHMGQQGLIFVYLPALLLVSAAAFDSLFQGQAKPVLFGGLAIILLSSAIFLFLPEYPLGANSQRLLTRQTLVNSDRYYSTRFEAIRKTFSATSTLILAENWHHVQFYLPEYRVIPFNLGAKWEIDEGAPVDNT
ncbi:MAG TPA: hypothetical protein PJ988_16595, partial [Anaerolinea sp.]|nr:hypothetical protein [Anaerolinea sp.]